MEQNLYPPQNAPEVSETPEELEEDGAPRDFPWVLFTVDGVVYGVYSTHVLSIEILGDITPMVDSPPYMKGITNFRGEMIALLDMRTMFNLRERGPDERGMVVVLEVDGVVKGMVVDGIVSVEYISKILELEELQEKTEFVRNVGKREKDNSTVQLVDETRIMGM